MLRNGEGIGVRTRRTWNVSERAGAHQQFRTPAPTLSDSCSSNFHCVFGWGALKGIDLWRGKPSGYQWARILFALQIPAFSVARSSYEFSTGASARVLFGNSNRRFGTDIGSSLNFQISPEPQGRMLGINFVAVLVLIYLLMVWRSELARARGNLAGGSRAEQEERNQ